MYIMQYFMPAEYAEPDGRFDDAAAALGPLLRGYDTKGAFVPNSALWLKLHELPDRTFLEFKKRKQVVYLNFFCTRAEDTPSLLTIVQGFYDHYSFGTSRRPTVGNWIHSIPVGFHLLRPNEVQLCEKLTVAIFYSVFGMRLKSHTSLN
jgi:hypothetical protein